MSSKATEPTPQVGREELVAEISTRCGVPVKIAESVVQAIFGLGGAGPVRDTGGRTAGIIEYFVDQGIDMNIRGFGRFRRAKYKAHPSRINGVEVQCRAKKKLSFKASDVTDILM